MITSKDSDKSIALVRSAFRQYYFKHSKNIGIPTRMKEREFGYKQFSSGIVPDIFRLEILENFWPF